MRYPFLTLFKALTASTNINFSVYNKYSAQAQVIRFTIKRAPTTAPRCIINKESKV